MCLDETCNAQTTKVPQIKRPKVLLPGVKAKPPKFGGKSQKNTKKSRVILAFFGTRKSEFWRYFVSTIYQNKHQFLVAGLGIVIVIGAIIASMAFAMYTYTQYQVNYIESTAGDTVKVGPVEYIISFEGTHQGSDEVAPENTFVKIGINAKNISNDKTVLSGGQFFILDEKDQRHRAIFGEFSANDLLLEGLDPGKPVQKTTQFDIPYDEESQYKIVIRPQKEQATTDTAVVCLTNCLEEDSQ